ncbi:putative bifunctional diguanylate cyclase/phosphodiesterase [Pseudoduganella umbonata]|uniref:Diguanylate cyclase (GGDEF)-like protein n=1 Tax=Pseudoduganella umbonata TaxID=864828 RepID=A0A4P8HNA5_9BURK|nr:EAL domain-containing protein [Pseudoduganella umbonata]MBB3219875.1 diguanylate cyclase (GGDEF)-like protein [Pseudoduganella umbonata]QCP09902.1 EAL domain-containing protein [Pseudoduganella umbonata]
MLSSPTSPLPDNARHALDGMLEEAGDIVFRLDPPGNVLFASRRAMTLLGAGRPVAGRPLETFVSELDEAALKAALAGLAKDGVARLELRMQSADSDVWFDLRFSTFADTDGASQVLVVGRDLSVQQATEERLRHMATHDTLTELPNRLLLTDRIRMTIAQARRSGQGFSVAAIGLDSFRKVNDGLGHPVGDTVLKMAAARLRKTLRDSDTLARVGGDEFVAVLPGTFNEQQIRLVTGRLLATLQAPFEIGAHTIYVGASLGVAVYPQHAEDDVRLVALADAALSRAKETGKARCVMYSPRHSSPTEDDISLEAAMFQAVREGEFVLHYQPIVDATTREIEGFETLMRWKHPTLGMVSPARFIPIAETNGLINLLGAWALKAACVQLRQFQEAAKRPLYISVNISPRQFRSDKFLEVLDDAISYSGLSGDQLVLEITEGTLMIDPAHAETILGKMAERRARIAIDDFGTGYSSLAYLKRFPISVLKIDRAFIRDLPASQKDGAICNAVLDLARHLSLSVVAEGVETEEQMAYMRERGCRYVQGYLTGKPMAANVAIAALTERHYEEVMRAEATKVVQ